MTMAKVHPPLPNACKTCPFRLENDSEPYDFSLQDHSGRQIRPRVRAEVLSSGIGHVCHCTTKRLAGDGQAIKTDGKTTLCTGTAALQQRAALRAWLSFGLGPLRSWEAVRMIVAGMLGANDGRGLPDPWRVQTASRPWRLNGQPITFTLLHAAAHPAVFDPNIASEHFPGPTAAELEQWRAVVEREQSAWGIGFAARGLGAALGPLLNRAAVSSSRGGAE
jgi:hypothetical protein